MKRFLNHFTAQGIPFKHYFFNLPFIYALMDAPRNGRAGIRQKHLKLLDEFCERYRDSNALLSKRSGLKDMSKFGYFLL